MAALHGLAAFFVAFVFSINKNPRKIDAYRGAVPSDVLHPVIDCNGTGDVSCPDKYSKTPIDQCKNINFPLVCKKVFTFDPSAFLVAFFLVTAIAHMLYAMDINGFYSYAIYKQGWNPYRWIEYFISASIMIFLISLLDGERNLNAATLLAFMTGVTQLQGFVVENNFLTKNFKIHNKVHDEILWRNVHIATWSGWLLFVGVWFVLVKNFFNVLTDANHIHTEGADKKVKIPIWVYGVVFSQVLNFALFGFVQRRQINDHKSGHIKPYESYEKQYITLSFTAKFILAGFVTYGILKRTSGDNC